MPEKFFSAREQKKEKIKKVEAEGLSAPDYIAEEKLLMDEIQNRASELSRKELAALVGRVFEHSSEAGLALADRLRFAPEDMAGAVFTPAFFIKHPELYKELGDEIRKEKPSLSGGASASLAEEFFSAAQDFESGAASPAPYAERAERTAKFHKEAEILFSQIDRHFLRALAQRKVSAKRESPSSESRGQALAEVALAQKERLLE